MFLSATARVEASLYNRLRDDTEAQGLVWFDGVYNLNLHAVRCAADASNLFDDVVICAYLDATGVRRVERWHATTDPGRKSLEKPMHPAGCFTMAPGQIRGLWTRGQHRGRYAALVHRDAVIVPGWRGADRTKVWRDAQGINLHTTSGRAELVDNWSAGCIVLRYPADLTRALALYDAQHAHRGSTSVSFTLHDVRQRPRLRALLLT